MPSKNAIVQDYSRYTDSDLLMEWKAGRQDAGQILLKRHHRGIYRFFSEKLTGDVSDLVQSTFLVCVEKRDTFMRRKNATFKTWLFGIARKKLYEHYRGKRIRGGRTVLMDPGEISCEDLGGSPFAWLCNKHDNELLRRALPRIPLKLQLLLELYLCEGFTGGALAEIMGIPENTVRSQFRRAKELLRKLMHDQSDRQVVDQIFCSISEWIDEMQHQRDERYPQLHGVEAAQMSRRRSPAQRHRRSELASWHKGDIASESSESGESDEKDDRGEEDEGHARGEQDSSVDDAE